MKISEIVKAEANLFVPIISDRINGNNVGESIIRLATIQGVVDSMKNVLFDSSSNKESAERMFEELRGLVDGASITIARLKQ